MELTAAEPLPLPSGALGATGPDRDALIDAVANWCECLQGRQPLVTALRRLAEGFGARAVALSRLSRGPGATARTVAWSAPGRPAAQRVTRSFAACVLGPYVDRPRVASVWLSSLTDDGDPALALFHARARLRETAVIALTVDGRWTDFLEIHFAERLGPGGAALLNMVAGTLARTWAHRSPGLFSDALLASQAEARVGFPEPLLSVANPARLSRAEFRVCLLLSRGLNNAAVCGELAISPSTLKAHLRSIFAKTETGSLAELLFRLLAPRRDEGALHAALQPRRA
jgi:DNA-binding CsgD family transcriptional regulator